MHPLIDCFATTELGQNLEVWAHQDVEKLGAAGCWRGWPPRFEVERSYRDAPSMIIGEGTNEIQPVVLIARGLVQRHRVDG